MKPLQAALTSKAAAFLAPRECCTEEAHAGKMCSGVQVAVITKSRESGLSPATSRAPLLARTAMEDAVSLSAAILLSLMPVRLRIQASEVLTKRSSSWFVSTFSGRYLPHPVTLAYRAKEKPFLESL